MTILNILGVYTLLDDDDTVLATAPDLETARRIKATLQRRDREDRTYERT